MSRGFFGIASLYLISCLTGFLIYSDAFAYSCNSQGYSSLIGVEFVAVQCIPKNMSDDTSIYYRDRYYYCSGSTVIKIEEGYNKLLKPNQIMYPENGMGSQYRHFRNKEGSYFLDVSTSYRGTIDGKSMSLSDYSGGGVYTDIFTQVIDMDLLPLPADCQGSDFNGSGNPPAPNGPVSSPEPGGSSPSGDGDPGGAFGNPTEPPQPPYPPPPTGTPPKPPCTGNCCTTPPELPGSSTINLGTGRLAHAQQLFTLITGSPLFMGVSLHYVSKPFAPSTIGNGWSHNYEAKLQIGTNGIVTYWTKGVSRTYKLIVDKYYSERGDYSTLNKNSDGSYVVTDTAGLKTNFNASGVLTSIVDRYGNTLNFIYNTNGQLTEVNDASASIIRKISFVYFDDGKLKTVKDPSGNSYSLEYPDGLFKTLTLPGGDQWGYTYDSGNGLLGSKTDPNLNQTTYGYDSNQRIFSVLDPQQQSRTYTPPAPVTSGKFPDYYPFNLLPNKVFDYLEKDNGGWKYTYDTLTGRVSKKIDPLGNISDFTYDNNGNMLSITEPAINGIRYARFFDYDAKDNLMFESEPITGIDPTTVTKPASDARIKADYRYVYDVNNTNPAFKNRILSFTDERNSTSILTTTYSFSIDASGFLVTTIINPANISSTVRQHPNGTIKDIIDATGKTTSYTYRSIDGLPESIAVPSGVSVNYTDYDANGNAKEIQIKDSDGTLRKKTVFSYDSRNRLHDSTIISANQPDITTVYGYDAIGNMNSVLDPELRTTLYEYNYNRQIKKITDALGKITTLTYGSSSCPSCGGGVDQMTDVQDTKLHQTHYTFDKLGRLSTETDPLGKTIKYIYDGNGLLKEKIDATDPLNEKLQITYNYNKRRQLTSKHFNDNTPDVTYEYENGRLKTAANGNISYTFSNYTTGIYKGRPKSIIDTTNNRTISYDQYTNLGQRKQVTVSNSAGSRTTSYQYDSANRPWYITVGSKVFTYLYDKLGRRDTFSYPNGIIATHTYDNLDRLTKLKHSNGSSPITFANYTGFDKTGNRKSKITPYSTENYHYDEIYRLTQTDTPKGSEKYTYDDVGNRTGGPGPKESLPIVTYTYDNANRMTHGRQLGYEYDNAGNQIIRTISNAPNKGWTLTWDLDNRLTRMDKVKKDGNGVVIESRSIAFKYDPFGRRIEKKLTTLIDGTEKITTWQYAYDGSDIALEIYTPSTGSAETTYFTHGPGIDEHLAMERDGSYYYYHADGLGSITAITNGSAGTVQTYSYDSFGVPKQTSGFRNSFMYVGKEYDLETGLTEMGTRYYDPREGRFVSKDSISYLGGINVYAYVQNNPINYIDPEGYMGTLPYLPALQDLAYKVATVRPGKTMDTSEKIYDYLKGNACRENEKPSSPVEGYNPFAPKTYTSPNVPASIKPQLLQ